MKKGKKVALIETASDDFILHGAKCIAFNLTEMHSIIYHLRWAVAFL